MRIKLGQVAEVRTGYAFRGAVNKASRGSKLLVQMGDLKFLREGRVDTVGTTDIKIRSNEWTLQEGDLLLKARGTDFTPLVVEKELHGAVFTHPLLRLRLDRELVLPEFLAWQLSQPRVQRQLYNLCAGTSVIKLDLRHLKEVEIELPPLSKQRQAQEVLRLMKKEEGLLNKLVTKRKQLVSSYIESLSSIGE